MKKMTPSQMRVAIAKDAIKQIKSKRFIITTGLYFWNREQENSRIFENEVYDRARLRKLKRCQVCELGAALVSAVRLFNQIEISCSSCNEHYIAEMLGRWFSIGQMSMMESAFETDGGNLLGKNLGSNDMDKCLEFRSLYPNDRARAIAIFRNIIKHKGTFKP